MGASTQTILHYPTWSAITPRGYQKLHTVNVLTAPPGCSIRYLPGVLTDKIDVGEAKVKSTNAKSTPNLLRAQQWDAVWNNNMYGVNDGNWTVVCTERWDNTVEPTATPTTTAPTAAPTNASHVSKLNHSNVVNLDNVDAFSEVLLLQ